MELAEFYRSKALQELREDDLRREQSLEQFREWISKQSHVTNCRTGMMSDLTPGIFLKFFFHRRQLLASIPPSQQIFQR
jgi:hypothetical protein